MLDAAMVEPAFGRRCALSASLSALQAAHPLLKHPSPRSLTAINARRPRHVAPEDFTVWACRNSAAATLCGLVWTSPSSLPLYNGSVVSLSPVLTPAWLQPAAHPWPLSVRIAPSRISPPLHQHH